jgi:hypothetical protein
MSILSNFFGGLAKAFLVIMVVGILAGIALSNSDLTNFITNSAKAEGIRQQNAVQQQKDAVDAENYTVLQKANTQAQLDKIAADTSAYKKSQAQKLQAQAQQAALELEMSRLFDYGKIAAGMILAICVSAILFMLTVQFTRSRLVLTQTQVQVKRIDAWQDPALRKQEIESARQRERMARTLEVRQTQTAVVPAFYPEEAPISWEEIRQQFAEARKNRKAN